MQSGLIVVFVTFIFNLCMHACMCKSGLSLFLVSTDPMIICFYVQACIHDELGLNLHAKVVFHQQKKLCYIVGSIKANMHLASVQVYIYNFIV